MGMIDEQYKDNIINHPLDYIAKYKEELKRCYRTQVELLEQNDIYRERLKNTIKDYEQERLNIINEMNTWKNLYMKAKHEIETLEKLIELNMSDCHDIADQRDWYYEEYRKLKDKLA